MENSTDKKMTGGEAIVKSLINEGVKTIFGLPGIQLDPMFNSLHDSSNEIRVINARHEQGVAYMAFGYAQSTGKPSVCSGSRSGDFEYDSSFVNSLCLQ